MENFKRTAKHSVITSSVIASVLSSSLFIGEMKADELRAVAVEEKNRRLNSADEAKKQVVIGDAAYEAGSYGDAVEAYKRAVGLLPDAPAVETYKEGVYDRYSKAVIAYSGQLSREGKYEEGQALLASLMDQEVYAKKPAVAEADSKFNDPIRNNPSATPKHTANVDKVRRLLYEAKGAYDLGDYDQSKKLYDSILLIDPYNAAARRGQQEVHSAVRNYARSANDEARTRLLTDVAEAWEIEPKTDFYLGEINTEDGIAGLVPVDSSTYKTLTEVIIPNFDVENASIISAVNRLKILVAENSPTKEEVNLVVNLGDETNLEGSAIRNKRFSLNVKNIPASAILDLICKQTNTEWVAEQYSATVVPNGQSLSRLFRRTFLTPPGFVSSSLVGNESLNTEVGGSNVTRKDVTVETFLKGLGITFPTGTTAHYSRTLGLLTMVNTPANMKVLEQAIAAARIAQNVVVKVDVKIYSILQEDLEELGYDFLLGDQSLNDSIFLGGGSAGNGTAILPGSGIADIEGRGVTSGLRSGETASSTDSVVARILEGQNLVQVDNSLTRAPGILEATAFANNSQVQAILRGLDQKNGIDRLQLPSVTTNSGERARFVSARLFPYPTDYDPPQIPNNFGGGGAANGGASIVPITPPTATAFEEREVGVILDVEPTVSLDRTSIDLDVNAVFTEFIGFVDYGSPILTFGTNALGAVAQVGTLPNSILQPVFQDTKIETAVTISDGASIAIGGFNTVQISQVNDKVPVISSLPYIGRFFETNATQTIRNTIVIFASAELMDLTGRPWRKQ